MIVAQFILVSRNNIILTVKRVYRTVKNGDIDNNEISDHSWKLDYKFSLANKPVIDCEKNLVAGKVIEMIHFFEDKKYINSIWYGLPEIWLPMLKK